MSRVVAAQPSPRLPRWIAIFALANAAIALSYVGLWAIALAQGLFWRADFTAFYTAGAMVRDGAGGSLYDFAAQTAYQQRLLAGRSFSDGLLPFVNPPHVALLFAPLAWLPLPVAYYLWTAGQVALLAVLVRTIHALCRGWRGEARLVLLSAVLAAPPLFFTLMRGTFSLLILVALLCLYRHLLERRAAPAGLWLAAASVKPQLVLLPSVALLLSRRWAALLVAGLACAGLALATAVALGPASLPGFLGAVRTIDSYYGLFGVVPATMYNLKGTLTLWLGDERGALIGAVSNVAFGLSLLATLLLWRRPWAPGGAQFELRFALTVLLGLLLGPHLHSHDGLLMVAPAVLAARYLYADPGRRGQAALLTLAPAAMLLGEFTIQGALGIRAPTLAMAMLAAWLVREIRRLPAEA